MLGSEGKPPAAVMIAQIIHDAAIARMTYATKDIRVVQKEVYKITFRNV